MGNSRNREEIVRKIQFKGEKCSISKSHHKAAKKLMINGDYQLAIQEYTNAIICYDKNSKYYTNRAECYFCISDFDKVITDSRIALALDKDNEIAFNLLGIGLIEFEKPFHDKFTKTEEGIRMIDQALKLSQKKTSKIRNNNRVSKLLIATLKKAKKLLWLKRKNYRDKKIEEIKTFFQELFGKEEALNKNLMELIEMENSSYQIFDIPDFFLCKINYEMLNDPVLTPDGISYDRRTLLEHLTKLGYFDPVTRNELDNLRILENKNIVEALNNFEEKHPWSYNISEQNKYFEIKLK